jgi:flagellar biosynthesis anti-sigma factor FlgM
MKITNNGNLDKLGPTPNVPKIQKPQDNRRSDKANNTGATHENSQVSPLAQQIAEAKRVADSLPDVRADRVELAKQRLSAGYYDTPEAKEEIVSKLAQLIRETST